MEGGEAVRIELQYSGAGTALALAMAAGTAIVVALAPWPWALRAALWACVLAFLLEALDRVFLLRGPRAARILAVQRDGGIEVEGASGARAAGRVVPGSFVAPWLVIVRWRREGAAHDSTVLVLPDMARGEELRRLRILLRWNRGDP